MTPPENFPSPFQVGEVFDAVREGRIRPLQTLMYHKPDAFHQAVDPRGSGDGLLHAAMKAGDHAIVNFLVQKNFPLDQVDSSGRSLLHLAQSSSMVKIILQAAKHGSLDLLASQDFAGNLPYHSLAKNGARDALYYLLKITPNLHAVLQRPNREGSTALHEMARSIPSLLPVALASRVDPRIQNASGLTAFDLCTDSRMKSLLSAHMTLRDKTDAIARADYLSQIKSAEALETAAKAKAYVQQSTSAFCRMDTP